MANPRRAEIFAPPFMGFDWLLAIRSALPRKLLQEHQILHETIEFRLSSIRIGRAQNGRGMGCDQTGLTNRFDVRELSAHIGNPDGAPENAGSSGGAKAYHNLRLNQLDLH
jgi:hypothetical protein